MDLQEAENILSLEVEVNPTTNSTDLDVGNFWPKLGTLPNVGIGVPKIGHPP